jgi:hypothetical protein
MPRRASLLCLFLFLTAPLFAAEPLADSGLYDYTGDLEGKILVGLTLHQGDGLEQLSPITIMVHIQIA